MKPYPNKNQIKSLIKTKNINVIIEGNKKKMKNEYASKNLQDVFIFIVIIFEFC